MAAAPAPSCGEWGEWQIELTAGGLSLLLPSCGELGEWQIERTAGGLSLLLPSCGELGEWQIEITAGGWCCCHLAANRGNAKLKGRLWSVAAAAILRRVGEMTNWKDSWGCHLAANLGNAKMNWQLVVCRCCCHLAANLGNDWQIMTAVAAAILK